MVLLLAVPLLAGAAGFDLEQLMGELSRAKSGQATFTEERHVAQLDQILRSSGRLSFDAPDTFVRETLRPRRERLAVEGNQLTLTQGGRTRTTTLDSLPEAAVIVEAIRGTLTGNRATLERYFTTTVKGNAAQWQLELVPRDARLRGLVAQLQLTGEHGQVREIRMEMADGDRTVTRIDPAPARDPAARP